MNETYPKPSPRSALKLILGLLLLVVASLIVVACSDFNLNGVPTPGASKIIVVVTDPATCQSPNGPYSHVYVTISDVLANMSDTSGTSDSGWVDLTPNLSGAPIQVDLLGKADSKCFLATLGANSDLTPGTYKQFRVVLAANSAAVSPNACGSSASCVVLASDSSVHPLEISAEASAGILISPRQVVGTGLSLVANQTKNLDINFLVCESIVQDEQGTYRLKPVVNAGEARFATNSLRGKVLDGGTGQPVKGSVLVALERPDGTGASRVLRATLAEADGSFIFCPLPIGSYDMVIVGTGSDGTVYAPSILVYLQGGTTNIGEVNLYPLMPAADSFVTLTGTLASQNNSHAGTVADVTLSVLEKASNNVIYTIPMPPTSTQSSATLNLATAPPGGALTCPTGTYCAQYSIQVPAGSANVAVFPKDGTHLSSNTTLPTYVMDAVPSVPSSGNVMECNYLPFRTQPFSPSAGGVTVEVPALRLTHCQ